MTVYLHCLRILARYWHSKPVSSSTDHPAVNLICDSKFRNAANIKYCSFGCFSRDFDSLPKVLFRISWELVDLIYARETVISARWKWMIVFFGQEDSDSLKKSSNQLISNFAWNENFTENCFRPPHRRPAPDKKTIFANLLLLYLCFFILLKMSILSRFLWFPFFQK